MDDLVFVSEGNARSAEHEAPAFVGISAQTVGATGLSMKLLVLPPGRSTPPHRHLGYESGVYLVAGDVEVRWGEGLTQLTRFEPGTFCFVPAGVPHVVTNVSVDQDAVAVVARNDPGEEETVQPVSYSSDGNDHAG